MDLDDLIERVKHEEGPNREMDEEIFIQITPGVLEAGRIDRLDGMVGWWPKDGPYQSAVTVPRYTGSIEAALSLVPKGMFWVMGFGKCRETEPLGGASVMPANDTLNPAGEAEAATVELAMCAAALEARLSLQPST